MTGNGKSRLKVASIAIAAPAAILLALLTGLPTMRISPESGLANVRTDSRIHIETPPLTTISKVVVMVNGEQKWLEYNIEGNDYYAPTSLAPGSTVQIDAKATSTLGVVRDYSSTFTTVEPIAVTSAEYNGKNIGPGAVLPPQAPMSFSFSKPAESAWVSIDDAVPIPVELDGDGLTGFLSPNFVLKQGASHRMAVWALGADGSSISSGNQFAFNVVEPLQLTADATNQAPADGAVLRLASSKPFSDPELVRRSVQVSAPETCQVGVDNSGILLKIRGPVDNDLVVTVSSAFGIDGSYLELPVDFHFSGGGPDAGGATGSHLATTVSAAAGAKADIRATQIAEAGSKSGDSDVPPPPPGWPPCCPWPPR